ncbi:radical SAM family heme chaperone HemW [Paenibacillus thermoaerophilus]|uniref:Heme chaperone HemW n=1 Tax=Paenibacillus thermoaerophilus TaxID=1215385 RepID=A0ABW2V177_9BACL|nr:radical SAM family heme chaperone HemW [Paenibacillus thermoaerophilus]TMV19204.1 oxygen-independent coproporphyrinogen III oxidase [Paenibacillus thermoaerophilus]
MRPVPDPKAVYIHIPFCTNKCHYCDFNSYVLKGQPVDGYLRALDREMELTAARTPPKGVSTIFVGGGTPTVLTPPQMARFLASVANRFGDREPDLEFTMEANPGTTDPDKLAVMREGGVNRISFGVQSFDNGLLSVIGRIHNTDDVYRSIEWARAAGFDNLSIDLMFGLPNQTIEQLDRSIDAALALELPHYSVYGLKVEENTLFHTLYNRGQLPLPSEETELAMYVRLMERMREAGYVQYEVSNFAKPGYESRHNMTYWRNLPYYGLGAGAHGYVGGIRHVNVKGIADYIAAAETGRFRIEEELVSDEEAMEDFMMVGFRMLSGVRRSDFAAQFPGRSLDEAFGPSLEKLLREELIEPCEDGYRLTQRGLLLGNEVFGEFLGTVTTN